MVLVYLNGVAHPVVVDETRDQVLDKIETAHGPGFRDFIELSLGGDAKATVDAVAIVGVADSPDRAPDWYMGPGKEARRERIRRGLEDRDGTVLALTAAEAAREPGGS